MSAASASTPPSAGADDGTQLRERKKRATRRALQLAGLTLVAERGLDAVTTEEIAAAAGVSQRTLFNYFASKEEVLVGHDPDLVQRLAARLLDQPPERSSLEALREVCLDYAEYLASDEKRWRLRMQVLDANPTLLPAMMGASAVFGRALKQAIAARTGTDAEQDLYPGLVVSVALTAMRIAQQRHAASGFALPMPDLTSEAFDLLLTGLPDPPRSAPGGPTGSPQ